MGLLTLIIVVIIVTGIGGGGFYLMWLKSRPKKETWNAEIYQLGEGVKEITKNRDGKIISTLRLKDLKPYQLDIIEKIEKEPGITVYRLQKLNKPVPAIEGNVVDNWGVDKKRVCVLFDKGSYTLLKKGFDSETSEKVFQAMPAARINMMKSEMAIRKDRLHKEKDILQAITPWIVTGICMLGLIGLAYIMVAGFGEYSERMENVIRHADETLLKLNDCQGKMTGSSIGGTVNLGQVKKETSNPVTAKTDPPPPLIEGG